jgi:hypothetical protein
VEGQQPRTGELVHPSRRHLGEQRGDGDVGDVVGVDDRFGDFARR